MRKIIQIITANFTEVDREEEFDEQRFTLLVLCDDNTIWQYMGDDSWVNIDTSQITDYIKPKDK